MSRLFKIKVPIEFYALGEEVDVDTVLEWLGSQCHDGELSELEYEEITKLEDADYPDYQLYHLNGEGEDVTIREFFSKGKPTQKDEYEDVFRPLRRKL